MPLLAGTPLPPLLNEAKRRAPHTKSTARSNEVRDGRVAQLSNKEFFTHIALHRTGCGTN